jgi:hypothetical protein
MAVMPSRRSSPPKRAAAASGTQRPSPRSLWKVRLKELAAFKRKHGHCNVPGKYPSLGKWVANLRQRRASLNPELVRRLEALGFCWTLRSSRRDWDTMVAAFAAFRERYGDRPFPERRREYRDLGQWLSGVRQKKRRGQLTPRKVRQLEKLGVVWEPAKQRWEKMFAALVEYKARHGDCNARGNPRLAAWVCRLRLSRKRHSLKQAYIDRLDEIGFVWSRFEEQWNSVYAALGQYHKAHGHCNVSTLDQEHASLGNWVRTQRGKRRKGKLSAEQIQQLDRLGFGWEVPHGPCAARGRSGCNGK